MNEILLVFVMSTITVPVEHQGPEISQKVFSSKAECAEFVDLLAMMTVVGEKEPNRFDFVSEDGFRFRGGCFTQQEYMQLEQL